MRKLSTINKILAGSAIAAGGLVLSRVVLRALHKFDLNDKVVLITGGSRGLGLEMARQLVDKGAKVAVCARDEEELISSAEELAGRTQHYLAIPCDITDKKQVKQMVEETESILGPVDVLINNAGSLHLGPMESMTEQDYQDAMGIHFWGPFHVMNEVIPSMKKRKQGHITNIVSIGGRISFPHLLPYNASKYALSGLSEGMAAELRKDNIIVTTVYPGLMRTGSPRNVDMKGRYWKEYTWFNVSDIIPFISIGVEKAARRIIRAMQYGEHSVTLSIPAKLAEVMHGIAPDLTISAFELINRWLPKGEDLSRSNKSQPHLPKSVSETSEKESKTALNSSRL